MSRVVVLDSGPLGLVTQPQASARNEACRQWLRSLAERGNRIVVPEIIDYELRRELLRANKLAGLRRLDALIATASYEPLTTEIMRLAAEFWAEARRRGRPTAMDPALDIDMILAAQARVIEQGRESVIIATTNVQHLTMFVEAEDWQAIS